MRVLFRADGSPEIGLGHLYRCLALAAALRTFGAECLLAAAEPWPDLDGAGAELVRLPRLDPAVEPAWLEDRLGRVDLLVCDHYGRDLAWQRAARSWAGRVAALDDQADRALDCDLLLNASPAVSTGSYRDLVPAGCRFLLGPKFALLRPEFGRLRAHGPASRVFIGFGGADAGDETAKALEALALVGRPGLAAVVAVGAAYPRLERLRDLPQELPFGVEIHSATDRVAELMAGCGLSLGAAGGMAWERCALGLPALIWTLASNQEPNAAALDRAGAAICLGRAGEVSPARAARVLSELLDQPDRLAAMSGRARALCDGRGTVRAARACLELLN